MIYRIFKDQKCYQLFKAIACYSASQLHVLNSTICCRDKQVLVGLSASNTCNLNLDHLWHHVQPHVIIIIFLLNWIFFFFPPRLRVMLLEVASNTSPLLEETSHSLFSNSSGKERLVFHLNNQWRLLKLSRFVLN